MKIAIASDHGGFALKDYLLNHYKKQGLMFEDLGTHSEESCDYPLIADALCRHVLDGRAELGILICGTGIGISIAANRHKGIRAALLYNDDVARLAREHNNANVAVFGGRMQKPEDVVRYLDTFLAASFEGGRHQRRIDELDKTGD
ncbi:MAG: ribose 5-phosphate isomerase B [Alphaproteobacteria bacterium]|nr:ribose 5-phosphate isomerase B [Alphaproteobacteria bacterium]